MSIVTYNGVSLPYPMHTAFKQQTLYEPMGNVDWYCTEFDIAVTCFINVDYLRLLAPSLVGVTTNPADIMKAIRATLLKPRKTLSVKFNGAELIPLVQTGLPGTVDAENGPLPQSCSITNLTNTTFLLEYRILAHYWESNVIGGAGTVPLITNAKGNNVLYNRWSETVEYNECQFATYTREGKYVIRSDNADGFMADQVRNSAGILGVRPSFLRTSTRYKLDPSGLGIEYAFTEKEQYKMPPYPAFTADGYYIESTTIGGAIRYGEVHVHLKASKVSSQADLVQAAISVAVQKIELGKARNPAGQSIPSILQAASVRTSLYENEVEVMIKVMYNVNTAKVKGIANIGIRYDGQASTRLVKTPISDDNPNYTPNYLPSGTASFLLKTAQYYDPSNLNIFLNPKTGDFNVGTDIGTAGADLET